MILKPRMILQPKPDDSETKTDDSATKNDSETKKNDWNQGWFRNQGHLETKNGTAQQSSGVHFFSFRSIKAEVAQ